MSRRHHVVIIGSGFGGLTAARRLAKAEVDVTVISRTSHHLFQPLLYQVATGLISEGQIAPQTRVVLRTQKNARVVLGAVERIDVAEGTVTVRSLDRISAFAYDSLIVAAGADQSYFGHDEFAEFAPGLKTIDDALELRGRILGAFEQAELSDDPEERARLLTFVVVGAGATGVEMAGQIAELASTTLRGAFRSIDPTDARVILIDAACEILPAYGGRLSRRAAHRLERADVEIRLETMVVDMDYDGLDVRDSDGRVHRIDAQCKIWSAGVSGSPLGRQLAAQTDVELDRAGRVKVAPDLTVPGHPEIAVVGDMVSIDGVPGMAPAAIQAAAYAAEGIRMRLAGEPTMPRERFRYWDKGSMATVARYSAIAKIPIPGTAKSVELAGFWAWVGWLVLHLLYLVGFRNRFTTLIDWMFSFTTRSRNQLAITEQQVFARTAIDELEQRRRDDAAA